MCDPMNVRVGPCSHLLRELAQPFAVGAAGAFGSGNEVSARLYDKTLEIQKSGKDYMRPLWAMEGWNGQQDVWRMEF